MANFLVTPNMNLPNPVPVVDPGPDYANNIQSSLNIVDQHNHTPGSGVQITTAGININSSLPFNGQAATGLGYAGFLTQGAGVVTPVNYSLYFSGLELFVQDGAGNAVQITTGGAVNATSSGISSGTATASFVGSVLVVNADTNKPANIQGASLLLGNNVTSSNYLTLSPPNAMAASYDLTLPSLPAFKSIMAIDTSGNITGAYTVDNSTIDINGSSQIEVKDGGITNQKLAPLNYQISSSSGTFSTSATTYTAVTNLSVTVVTSGRPVYIAMQPDGSGSLSGIFVSTGTPSSLLKITNGVVDQIWQIPGTSDSGGGLGNGISLTPVSSFSYIDTPSAGTHTYTVSVKSSTSIQIQVARAKLFAYEIS